MEAKRPRNKWGEGERLRGEVLEAAQRLLQRGGTDEGLSLRAIAREAGVTAPSIYRQFASRTEIVWEVLDASISRLIESLDQAASGSPDPRRRLDLMAEAYVRFAIERPAEYQLMFGVNQFPVPLEELARHPVTRLLDTWVAAVGGLLADRPHPRLDAKQLAQLLWTGLHGQVSLWRALPVPEESPALTDNRINLLTELFGR